VENPVRIHKHLLAANYVLEAYGEEAIRDDYYRHILAMSLGVIHFYDFWK